MSNKILVMYFICVPKCILSIKKIIRRIERAHRFFIYWVLPFSHVMCCSAKKTPIFCGMRMLFLNMECHLVMLQAHLIIIDGWLNIIDCFIVTSFLIRLTFLKVIWWFPSFRCQIFTGIAEALKSLKIYTFLTNNASYSTMTRWQLEIG